MRLNTTTSLAAIAAVLAAAPAFAADQPAAPAGAATGTSADADATQEIVVTAQKRTQNIQSVPIAVSVVSGDALNKIGALNIENVQYLVPSLNFRKSGTSINQSIFLRGVGTATFSIAGEPSVSTVLDGVVLSRQGEAFTDLADIERIEVLRGPQGTLFGKNSSAGVINIVTKRPTSQFGGYVEASYFSESEVRLKGVVNIPISDTIRTRITGFGARWDGNIYNQAVNKQVNGYSHWGVRGVTEVDVTPSLLATFIADYHRNRDNCCAEVIGSTPLININPAGQNLASNYVPSPLAAVLPAQRGDLTRRDAQNLITRTEEDGWGFSLQLDQKLGDHVLTSISAYRRWDNREIRDGDFLPQAYTQANQLHDDGPQSGDTFTQELRITSPGNRPLTYTIGAFYYYADTVRTFTRRDVICSAVTGAPTTTQAIPCGSALANPSTAPFGSAFFGSTFNNYAIYADGALKLTPGWRLIGGLRFTRDELNVFHSRVSSVTPNAAPGIQPNFDQGVANSAGPGLPNGNPALSNGVPFRANTSAQNLSGRFGTQIDIDRDVMFYATWSRGYKGPAYNIFFNLTANQTNTIAPEESDSFELGLKNTLFGGKLILNVAGYLAIYDNFQANNPDVVQGVLTTRFTNAGRVSTRGFELDALFRPSRDFSASFGAAYTDAHVDQFKPPVGGSTTGVIPQGTVLGYAPTWRLTGGLDYRIRTGGAVDFALGAQASYQSSQLSQFDVNPLIRAATTIRAYSLFDLSAAVLSANDRWRVTFFARNLFDESFAASIASGGPGAAISPDGRVGGLRYIIPREADRYFGVTGRFNF
ncbi:MAG: TonB-dependent receptor [Sphingomonadaceae bacterium]|nr:TonB-dependent receptor [Sphingomonadaceae bacterium]